jgi:epoxyqueuosine reductase
MGPLTDPAAIRTLIAELARAEGFVRTGIARAGRPPRFAVFEEWLSKGRHGMMDYLRKSAELRGDPERLFPGVRSIVVLAHPYSSRSPAASDGSRTARYALSEDYHRSLRRKCEAIVAGVAGRTGEPFPARVCVDSAPLAERSWAAAAGIGWIGKNAMVMNENDGSYFLLCEILTRFELPEDAPLAERCGSCVRCLQACPTQAFVRPGQLDARRCLSYWTIEQRGTIPPEIAANLGGWLFGCDACQEACPYNAGAGSPPFDRVPPTAEDLLRLGAAEWKRRFADTPLSRAGAAGLRRNAAASAPASGRRDLLPRLEQLSRSPHPVVAAQARQAVRELDPGRP